MKSDISALMDDALDEDSQASLFNSINRDQSLAQVWSRYHLIGDALRGSSGLDIDINDRVLARLADEPTVLAPVHGARRRQRALRYALPIAASVMGIGAVGWIAQALHQPQAVSVAKIQDPVPAQAVRLPVATAAANDTTEPTKLSHVRAYLFAHQGYSMESSIQGVAPYVRTVADAREVGGR
jgi:sigma-E factor negative regulatory protein RseA